MKDKNWTIKHEKIYSILLKYYQKIDDNNDENSFITAIRETFEETGFEIQRHDNLKDISSTNDKDKFYAYKLTKEEKK